MQKLLCAVTILAAACSSSGKARLLLTDAPADLQGVTAIDVTLSKIDVHVEGDDEDRDGGSRDEKDSKIDDDGKWVSLVPATKTFDLMKLQNNATSALGELDLPIGKITQLRLFIDSSKPSNNQVLLGSQSCPLDTSRVNTKGIKINHPFKGLGVRKGHKVEVTLDFVASDSITKLGDCKYQLDPVIHIKRARQDDADHDDDI